MRSVLSFVLFVFGLVAGVATAAPVNIEFVNTGSSIPYHGVYAGFYTAKVNGINVAVFCDDFTTWADPGDTWTANVFTYSDVQAGATTKFGSKKKYSQVGWLYSQTMTTPSTLAQIQGAVWNIMTPGAVGMDPMAQGFFNLATDGSHDLFDYTTVMNILTPVSFRSGQEFLVRTPVTVPAPAAIWLLGSGLLGIAAVSRKKK